MESLPTDVVREILFLLPGYDIANLELASSQMRYLCRDAVKSKYRCAWGSIYNIFEDDNIVALQYFIHKLRRPLPTGALYIAYKYGADKCVEYVYTTTVKSIGVTLYYNKYWLDKLPSTMLYKLIRSADPADILHILIAHSADPPDNYTDLIDIFYRSVAIEQEKILSPDDS